ncbi:MATE family efflux transporter [Clostridium sp. 'deep sea']|uniref:MATE family efflux transporter n=1 Tax=Clostridium sp. 'deep sea' TaxID=2779445 RepID=UPI00189648ED|nr:MATE family efflux transporter [Clostridium sp. 'deep sea']QOR35969.1 MATE family efflux transporter [Clostridium sp. 'deep sea']
MNDNNDSKTYDIEAKPKKVKLRDSKLTKTVWLLAWPVIVEMMLLTFVGIVDMAMVGRLGPSSIAAVGLGTQIVMIATSAFAAIRTGTTALVARHIGAKDEDGANVIARQSVTMTIILTVTTFVIFYIFAEGSLKLLGAKPDVVAVGIGYIRWRSFGLVFSLITMIFTSMLRGCGDTKTPMYVNIVINILNPIFNYIFIFGNFGAPKMGVAGAALGTVLSQVVGCILIIKVVMKGDKQIKLTLNDDYRLKKTPVKRILNIGIPAMVEAIFMRFAQIVFTMILTSIGTATYAAHQIAIRAESLSFMPGWGFGVAATTLIGQNLGAKEPELAEESGYVARNMAILVSSLMGILFFIFPVQFVKFFTDDQEVIKQAAKALRLVAIAQPAMAINLVIAGGLRGAGDTKWVTIITASSVWLVRLSIAAVGVFYFKLGLIGAWLGMVSDLFIRAIMFSIRYARGKWKLLKV